MSRIRGPTLAVFLLLSIAGLSLASGEDAVVRLPSHGASGTVIAVGGGRSWVLSCGHAFCDGAGAPSRELRGRAITIDAPSPSPGPAQRPGVHLLAVDPQADLSLLWVDAELPYVCPVAPSGYRPGQRCESVGYDGMRLPQTVRQATLLGSDDVTYTRERPSPGRSGGALLDADKGVLLGVVIGFETDGPRRGLYVSHATILHFLETHAGTGASPVDGRSPGVREERSWLSSPPCPGGVCPGGSCPGGVCPRRGSALTPTACPCSPGGCECPPGACWDGACGGVSPVCFGWRGRIERQLEEIRQGQRQGPQTDPAVLAALQRLADGQVQMIALLSRQQPSPAPAPAPAPAPSTPVLPAPGLPLQTLPAPGLPLQTLPAPGQPIQVLPAPGHPIQILPPPGHPIYVLPAPGNPVSPALPAPGTPAAPLPPATVPPTMPPASAGPAVGFQRYTRATALYP